MVVDALQQVGAARSIVIDEDNVVLAGNGVTEAAAEAGITKVQVVEVDGSTLVAVRRSGLTAEQKRALAIFDNRTAELAEWNAEQLQADVDTGLSLQPWFSADEQKILLAGKTGAPKDGLTDPDAVPHERPTSIKPGDLFNLGSHLLLCGDSTKPEDVARVMDGNRACLMNTDPPYGIDYVQLKKGIPGFTIGGGGADIANDDKTDGPALQAFLELMIRTAVPHLSTTCAFYFWHPMLTQGTFFAAAAAAADILIHRQIIWVKPGFVLTRSGQYHWKHELCFYGWVKGHPCPWYGPKNQTSVWECGRDDDAGQHPTQKPVELFRRPIQNHCKPGAVIYEPFSGSGSQLIAAQQLDVSCRAIELSPRYVQVAIDRWEQFTGDKAVKVGEIAHATA
jgi:DNA modification methylase